MWCFCLWQMFPFMVLVSYLVSALVWCWNSFLHWEFPWGGICGTNRWCKGGKNDIWLQDDFSLSPNYTPLWMKASAGCAVLTPFGFFYTVTSCLSAVYSSMLSFMQLCINVSVLQELMTCFSQKHLGYQQVICSYTKYKYGRSNGYMFIFTRIDLSFDCILWNLTVLVHMYIFNYWIFKTYIFRWLDVGWNLF
jgi:hypothetical protein